MTEARRKEWIFPEPCEAELGDSDPVNPLIAQIMRRRGIKTPEEMTEFLSPRPQLTFDPFLLKDMEGAVKLIWETVGRGEKICIYGDYDADGVTACSLLLTILGKVTDHLTYYIPSRFDEGYGLNEEAVKTVAAQGAKLLITVDCGSVSYDEVELAKKLGMEVIVTDHHNTNGSKAADCLLINPKQEGCPYPFKELSGCGVAFKLAQALQKRLGATGDDRLQKADVTAVLDLVAIATIGDIVPLVSENRSLVKYGLNILNQGKRPGLRGLVAGVGLVQGSVKSEQVAYIIVPHLNAAGRMLSAKTAVELLISPEDSAETADIRREAVELLVENNKERKRVQEKTFVECREILKKDHPEDPFQLIYAEEAHEGIAGIVAGKIKDATYRPTIIATPSGDGDLKGTGRSVEGIDLYQMLSAHRSLFQRFGGHSGACGFLMEKENLEALRRGLNEDLWKQLEAMPELLTERIFIDSVISPEDATMDFLKEADRLSPFGHKNAQPLFAIRNVKVKKVSYMGAKGEHVRFQIAGSHGAELSCILFQHAGEYKELFQEEARVDVVGHLGINVWNGTTKIQFVIKDLK